MGISSYLDTAKNKKVNKQSRQPQGSTQISTLLLLHDIRISLQLSSEIIHTTVLPPGGRSRQNLDEYVISRNPDPHKRVDMNSRSPFDIFENFNIIMLEDFFFAIS